MADPRTKASLCHTVATSSCFPPNFHDASCSRWLIHHSSSSSTLSMKLFTVDNEHYKLTIVIVLLNVLIITECVVLLVRATNPFFTSSDHPTSAFALFLAVQITAAAVLSVGICAAKDKMVLLNRGLFKTVAFTNAVYAIIFFVRKDVLAGFVMSFLVLINALGSLVCRRFFLHLTWNQQLPTTAPSSNQQLPTTVPSLNLNNTRV